MTALNELLGPAATAVFGSLVRASLQGGVFILLVWAACRFLPLPASVRCTLWWLACLKLVVGFVCVDPLPLPVLKPLRLVPVAAVQSGSQPALSPVPASSIRAVALTATKPAAGFDWSFLAVGVWATILALLLAALAHRIRKINAIAGRAGEAPREVRELAIRLSELLALRRMPAVRLSEEVDTPLVVGFRRPVVLLPAAPFAALHPAQQRMALCHELLHLRRTDLWLAHIPALAERLFFFHPLAHLAVREYQLTREAACDAAVIRELDAQPGDYGRLLLALGVSRLPMHLAAAGSASSYSRLKRRITMLRDTSKNRPGIRAAGWTAILLATLAVTPFTFVARSQDSERTSQPARSVRPAASTASAVAAVPVQAPEAPARAASPSSQRRQERERNLNYVLFLGDHHTMMSGSSEDTSRAESFRKGNEQMLWFRQAGREYVVRDPALLHQIQEIFQPLQEIGGDQAKIGSKQAEIGSHQAEIGGKQAEIGQKQAELGARQAQIGSRQAAFAARQAGAEWAGKDEKALEARRQELEKEHRQIELEMQQLDKQMQELNGQMQTFNGPMNDLSKQMNSLSDEMNVLTRKMQEASAKAEAEMSNLLDRAISSGAATEVK